MISAVVALAMGLGVSGPIIIPHIEADARGWCLNVWMGGHWNNSHAKIGIMSAVENAVISNYPTNKFPILVTKSGVEGRHSRAIARLEQAGWPKCTISWRRAWPFRENLAVCRKLYCRAAANIFHFQCNSIKVVVGIVNYEFRGNDRSLEFCRYFVSVPRLVESGFDQPNADRTERHANQRSNAHDFRPPGSDILRGKVLLFALAFACGFFCLAHAIRLSESGKGEAAFFYISVGIALIFFGGVGGGMAIS